MTDYPPEGQPSGSDTPIHDRTAAVDGVPTWAAPTQLDTDPALDAEASLDREPSLDPDRFDDDPALVAEPAFGSEPSYTAEPAFNDEPGLHTASVPPLGAGDDSDSSSGSKADAAKGAAQHVAGDAADAGRRVGGSAKQEAASLASEAADHARALLGETTETLREQAGQQQERAATGLKSLSEQLSRMADNDDEQGVASRVVRELSTRAESAAGYLNDRDPGSLLGELKSFAARRPGMFIAAAAGAGVLAGRLTKALTAEIKHEHDGDPGSVA
jgi:hypothetical protein